MSKFDILDTETVCALLGVSDRTIRTWVKDYGCPSKQEGRNRTFVWSEVLDWYVGYKSSLESGISSDFAGDAADPQEPEDIRQATLRKTKAEADLKQLQLARLRGEVIDIATAKDKLGRYIGNLRTALLNMAQNLSIPLEGVTDATKREAIIRDHMEDLCRELSSGSIVGGVDDETAPIEAIEAAAAETIGEISPELLDLCWEIIGRAPAATSIAMELLDEYSR